LMGSKAVGEPPLVLGLSVWAAAKQALASLKAGRRVDLALPATSEEILWHLCQGDGDGTTVPGELNASLDDPSLEANIRANTEF
jgi:hypothetical protein